MLILLATELAIRVWHPNGLMPNEESEDVNAYLALGPHVAAFGAREISVVGNSRPREALLCKVLSKLVQAAVGGTAPSVGNFSLPGAHAQETNVVVSRLLSAKPKPKLLVYGVTARDLATLDEGPPNASYLWRLRDWWADRSLRGSELDVYFSDAVRNEVAAHSYLFRLRSEIYAATHLTLGSDAIAALRAIGQQWETHTLSPMDGGPTVSQRGPHPNQSRKVTPAMVKRYLGRRYLEPEWPHTYEEPFLDLIAEHAQRAGVPLVFVEIPLSPALVRGLPPGTLPGFYAVMDRVASQHRVPFIRTATLGESFPQLDFSEQSHLNLRGAEKYSGAVGPKLAQFFRR